MDDLARLVAIEEIRRLKARYFIYLDARDWVAWTDIWAPDAELLVPEISADPVVGADAIVSWTWTMLANRRTIHHGHSAIIDVRSATDAAGIWTMEDRIFDAEPTGTGRLLIHGWGHYHEDYVWLPGGWRIKRSRLTRLRLETLSLHKGPEKRQHPSSKLEPGI